MIYEHRQCTPGEERVLTGALHPKIESAEIVQRAYELWLATGRPVDRDLEFWLQAEGRTPDRQARSSAQAWRPRDGPGAQVLRSAPISQTAPGGEAAAAGIAEIVRKPRRAGLSI